MSAGEHTFLVIGQGLAGTTLALKLLDRGLSVRIVDNGHVNSSTAVAAGLWNPIVFRRINKSWRADEFIASSTEFYQGVERLLGIRIHHPMEICRRHANQTEQNKWYEKKPLPEYAPYLKNPDLAFDTDRFADFPFGYGVVHGAGYVDLPKYLSAARAFFKRRGAWIGEEDLTEADVDALARRYNAQFVVDCRGYRAAQSPLWSYLPFGLTKGEVLTLRCPELHLERVFNAGFFLLPLGGERYRLGATFEWAHTDEVPTAHGKDELLDKFRAVVHTPFTVEDHRAGVRPTVEDRRPLLGIHPSRSTRVIFNGLGTKGVVMAPRLADELLDHLLRGVSLPPDIDIARFEDKLH